MDRASHFSPPPSLRGLWLAAAAAASLCPLSRTVGLQEAADRVRGERWRLHDFPVNQL